MSYFIDLSKLTKEDLDEIDHLASALSLNFGQALYKWINENPGKAKVLGEIKNGEIIKNEINENGVKEYKGNDALIRIIKEALEKKNEDS